MNRLVLDQPPVHFIPSLFLAAPDETDGLQPLNPITCQFTLPVHLPLGHNPSGQSEVLRPTVRHIAVTVCLSELEEFTIPAFPTIIVPVKLEPQILEPLDPSLATRRFMALLVSGIPTN